MLLNLAGPSYGVGFSPVLNWWTTGSQTVLVSTVNGSLTGQEIANCPVSCATPTTYIDTNGELVTPVPSDVTSISRIFFTPVSYPQYQYEGTSFTNYANQQFDVTWTGCAAPTVAPWFGVGTGGTSSFPGNNTGTLNVGSSNYSNIGLTFTMTTACRASPPKQINVFLHQHAARVAAGEFWDPDWLAAVRPFYMLRLMDYMYTNQSGITDISQLADANYTAFAQGYFMARSDFGNSISGTTLTIGGYNGDSLFGAGFKIVCAGCPSGLTIDHQLTGTTGQNGTYLLTSSGGTVADTIYLGVPPTGSGNKFGFKGGIHPSLACDLANKANVNIEYPIPAAATDQFVTDVATAFKSCLNPWLKVKVSYCNENWNSGAAFDCYRYVNAQTTPATGMAFAGYRAAQIAKIFADVFGSPAYSYKSPNGSRWLGAIGAQHADPTRGATAITGAKAYVATGIGYTLQQLITQGDVAPYWGLFVQGASSITNISQSATPTITAANSYTNGQIVRLFVNGGTMAAALNNIDVTVSSASGSSFVATPFSGSNPSTVGLTYGGSGNQAIDSTIYRMADRSAALNGSTPATYPTKFAYFNQQMSTAVLAGSASDSSYGTVTITGDLNLAGSVSFFQQNALNFQADGIELGQYEAGPTWFPLFSIGNTQVAIGAVEYLVIGQNFDLGVVGDAVNTAPNLYTTMFSQFDAVNGIYPAQFTDTGLLSQFGPWPGLRFLTDTSNPRWQAILAKNSAGRYSPNIPAPTGSLTYNNATDRNFGAASSTTLTCPVTSSPGGLLVVPITWTDGSIGISSVSVGGVGAMTQDAFTAVGGSWGSAIYSKAVSAGSYTVTITWSTSAPNRSCYALTLNNLLSNTKLSATSGNPQKSTTLNVTSGAFIIAAAALTGAPTFNTDSTQGSATGTVTQFNFQSAQASGLAYWSPGPSFSSAIFGLATNGANGIAAATYK
jgi:hypothetical protein